MIRTVRWIAAIVLVAGTAGYALYLFSIATLRPGADPGAQAIVVLTGAQGARVETGLRLLEDGFGERLLISGVSARATDGDIRSLAPGDAARFDCCVDLDRAAGNTAGNARETAQWVREHGYRRVLLVTHAYHMPRARLELSHAAPEVEFIPYPVGDWTELGVRRTVVEYAKYLVIASREAALSLRRSA